MRRLLLVLVASLFAATLAGQEGPQRGRIKKVDTAKGIVTIETTDGKESSGQDSTARRAGQAIAQWQDWPGQRRHVEYDAGVFGLQAAGRQRRAEVGQSGGRRSGARRADSRAVERSG